MDVNEILKNSPEYKAFRISEEKTEFYQQEYLKALNSNDAEKLAEYREKYKNILQERTVNVRKVVDLLRSRMTPEELEKHLQRVRNKLAGLGHEFTVDELRERNDNV